MKSKTYKPLYLPRVMESIWSVAEAALGENHLLTQAFETALRANDPDLMERALKLLCGAPEGVKQRLLVGKSPI